MSHHTRRQWLERLGIGAAGVVTAGFAATARGYWANETIRVGCIGIGGRCQHLMTALAEVPGTRIVALCDVWDGRFGAAKKLADPSTAITKDFRALLDRQDVDAVIIGTPDHWHTPITIAACAAGKDVYVEKPLTHNLEEGAAVIEAERRHQRIVQVGTQQRSMPQYQKAAEIIRAGEIGEINKVHLTWNRNTPRWSRNKSSVDPASVDWKQFLGNAPDQPFDDYRMFNWRWFWDFGGGIFTDLMVHQIDIAHWILDLAHPQTAVSIGDHFRSQGVWETPDTVQTLLQYPDKKLQAYFEGTFVSARNGAMIEFMGSEATLYLDRGRYEIHPERNKKIEAREWVIGSGQRGADFYDLPKGEVLHLANWAECIRSRKQPNAPASAGVSAASAAHLANMALRSGETAHWR